MNERKLYELMQQLGEAINKALSEDDDVSEAVQAFYDNGCRIGIIMAAEVVAFAPQQQSESEVKPPEPKVQGGKVRPGTFNTQDESWARKFKISLNPDDPPKNK